MFVFLFFLILKFYSLDALEVDTILTTYAKLILESSAFKLGSCLKRKIPSKNDHVMGKKSKSSLEIIEGLRSKQLVTCK